MFLIHLLLAQKHYKSLLVKVVQGTKQRTWGYAGVSYGRGMMIYHESSGHKSYNHDGVMNGRLVLTGQNSAELAKWAVI